MKCQMKCQMKFLVILLSLCSITFLIVFDYLSLCLFDHFICVSLLFYFPRPMLSLSAPSMLNPAKIVSLFFSAVAVWRFGDLSINICLSCRPCRHPSIHISNILDISLCWRISAHMSLVRDPENEEEKKNWKILTLIAKLKNSLVGH